MNINYLTIAGALSFLASAAHVGIVIGGPAWYRFFGAGEEMASMAERGLLRPTIITLCIAGVLGLWGAYAWSGAGIFPKFPLLKTALILITAVYLLRALVGFVAPLMSSDSFAGQNSNGFWIWSSIICLVFGLVHLKGILSKWPF